MNDTEKLIARIETLESKVATLSDVCRTLGECGKEQNGVIKDLARDVDRHRCELGTVMVGMIVSIVFVVGLVIVVA
jgi:hypothetical protein